MLLKYIAVGTGRDGTKSLTHVINDIFYLNGISATAAHEFLSVDCYNAYCSFKETGDEKYLHDIRTKLASCPYQAIIGNGYASLLGMFRALFPDLALIHLKRENREMAISSLIKNSKLFPETYLYYGAAEGIMRRVAAFHENEMSREEWDTLSLKDKFGWYYDYTHNATEKEKFKFSRYLDVKTEALSGQKTLQDLAVFVTQHGEPKLPDSVHLNRHSYLAVDDFDEGARSYAQWLFGSLSAGQISRNAVYLSEYVSNKYIALAGYQLNGFINEFAPAYAVDKNELSQSLDQFEALLQQRLREVSLLKAGLNRLLSEDES